MTTTENLKNELLDTLGSIDKNKLSLLDLKMYADILKTASEIQAKSYLDTMAEVMSGGFGLANAPTTVSELK